MDIGSFYGYPIVAVKNLGMTFDGHPVASEGDKTARPRLRARAKHEWRVLGRLGRWRNREWRRANDGCRSQKRLVARSKAEALRPHVPSDDDPLTPHSSLTDWVGGMGGYVKGKQTGLDQIRRPEVVIVNDPTQPPVQSNIKAVVECNSEGRGCWFDPSRARQTLSLRQANPRWQQHHLFSSPCARWPRSRRAR
jgi:hypothetical protein